MVCVDIDSSSRHNPEAITFTVGENLEVNVSKLRRTGSPLTAGRSAISGKEGVFVLQKQKLSD